MALNQCATRKACDAWLDENRPDWRDPLAYWDAE